MSIFIKNRHPTTAVDVELLRRQIKSQQKKIPNKVFVNLTTSLKLVQASCILGSFFDGKHSGSDAVIQFVGNVTMRRLGRRFANSSRTTDVLSFRLADYTIASRLARRSPVQMPWDKVTSSLPLSKFVDINTLSKISPAELEAYLEDQRLKHMHEEPEIPEKAQPEQPNEVGTIALAVDYCRRVARKRNIPLEYYLMLATTHGLAHLVGFVHYSDEDYLDMKSAEEEAIQAVKMQVGFGIIDEQHAQTSEPLNLPTSYLP